MEKLMEGEETEKKESYKSSEETKSENHVEIWVPRVIDEDKHPCLPGYDFFINLFIRFDTSFLVNLIL